MSTLLAVNRRSFAVLKIIRFAEQERLRVLIMYKRILLLVSFVACFFSLHAQDTARTGDSETNILYRNEAAGGLTLHSDGFGITFHRGWHVTGYKKRLLDIEAVSMRHPKQYKQPNPYYQDSRPFYFGKLNFAYFLRGGYGKQNILYSKAEQSGVEVRYNYYFGVDLAITKPVYLDVLVDDPIDSTKIIDTRKYDPNDPYQQAVENIYGPGPYFMGFDQMRFYPGVYGKLALSFEYAGWQHRVTALETGIVVDAFPKAVPIMAFYPNDHLFFNFYITLIWGEKW